MNETGFSNDQIEDIFDLIAEEYPELWILMAYDRALENATNLMLSVLWRTVAYG